MKKVYYGVSGNYIEPKNISAIKKFAIKIGLIETETELVFWHMYFGKDFLIDLSASNEDKISIMKHVFDAAVEFGMDKKTKEIKKVLGI